MKKWICGFQPISRLLCLLALSNPARWGSQLYSLSGFFAFIRRARVLHYWLFSTFLLSFLLLSGTSPVHAQDQTPLPDTPTPTNEPLIKTSTPMPTLNTNCNGYQPSGWGTVTPNAFWLQNCGHCVTSTPFYKWPEYTPMPWETARPTGTPLPTFTPTPVVGVELAYRPATGNCPVVNPALPETDIVCNSFNTHSYTSWPSPNIVFQSQSFNKKTKIGLMAVIKGTIKDRPGYNETVEFCYRNSSAGNIIVKSSGVGQEFTETLPVSTSYTCKNLQTFTAGGTLDKMVIMDVDILNTNQTGTDFDFKFTFGNNGSGSQITQNLFYWKDGGLSTPIVFDGFCGTVNGGMQTLNPDDIFGLPKIEVGWARCFQLGGWTIPLQWVQTVFTGFPESWTLPGIEFCFKPLTFGTMSILGIKIDLDFIAAAMAAVLLFRFLTRS